MKLIFLVLMVLTEDSYGAPKSFGCPCGVDDNNRNHVVYKNKARSQGRKKRSVAGNGSGAELAYLIRTVKEFKNGSVGEGSYIVNAKNHTALNGRRGEGRSGFDGTKIVGGHELAKPNPWFIYVKFYGRWGLMHYRCGGSILNEEWLITAAHCVCDTDQNLPCKPDRKKKYQQPNYPLKTIQIYVNSHRESSGYIKPVKKVIVHKDYRENVDAKTYNDIALIRIATKFEIVRFGDRPTMPICLPKRKFKDDDKKGYSVGFGVQREAMCKTDGVGPDVHRQCTKTMEYNYKDGRKGGRMGNGQCSYNQSPAMGTKEPCYFFHLWNSKRSRSYFSSGRDEVVLIPKEKGKKFAYTCIRSDVKKRHGQYGWCGTVPAGGSRDSVARPTVDSGWGYCNEDCAATSGKGQLASLLQIVKLDIINSNECKLLLKGIGSVKILSDYKQLCAGVKMPAKQTPLFFTYTGKRNKMTFIKMSKPIPGWKPRYLDILPGLNYMLGGRDTCQGDSGGPLWVRERIGRIDYAYLVGVVSAGSGLGCGQKNTPGLYVRVKNHLKWIKKYVRSGSCGRSSNKNKKKKKRKKGGKKKKRKKGGKKKKRKKGGKKKKKRKKKNKRS